MKHTLLPFLSSVLSTREKSYVNQAVCHPRCSQYSMKQRITVHEILLEIGRPAHEHHSIRIQPLWMIDFLPNIPGACPLGSYIMFLRIPGSVNERIQIGELNGRIDDLCCSCDTHLLHCSSGSLLSKVGRRRTSKVAILIIPTSGL